MPSTTPSLEELETELVSLREQVSSTAPEGDRRLAIDRRLDEIDAMLLEWRKRKEASDDA